MPVCLSLCSKSDLLVQGVVVFSEHCALCWHDKLIQVGKDSVRDSVCLLRFDLGWETSVQNRYLYKLGAELLSQESEYSLSFQLVGWKHISLEMLYLQPGSRTIQRIRRFGNIQIRC